MKKNHLLREYVRTKKNKNTKELKETGLCWVKLSEENRLVYEIDWLGIPIIQSPEDLILIQELIFGVQPDFIIETGIAHGGGLIYYASLMELLKKGKVIGVDIEIKEHNRRAIEAHPLSKRIEMIQGDSVSDRIIREIRRRIPKDSKVIVCLDSDHTKNHVFKELELYKDFIIPGCYLVVFDTIASELGELGALGYSKYVNNSPKEAVYEFLKGNNDFQIDKRFNKLYVSSNPDGYLKRIK